MGADIAEEGGGGAGELGFLSREPYDREDSGKGGEESQESVCVSSWLAHSYREWLDKSTRPEPFTRHARFPLYIGQLVFPPLCERFERFISHHGHFPPRQILPQFIRCRYKEKSGDTKGPACM